jgi:hypothetical protein
LGVYFKDAAPKFFIIRPFAKKVRGILKKIMRFTELLRPKSHYISATFSHRNAPNSPSGAERLVNCSATLGGFGGEKRL